MHKAIAYFNPKNLFLVKKKKSADEDFNWGKIIFIQRHELGAVMKKVHFRIFPFTLKMANSEGLHILHDPWVCTIMTANPSVAS